VLRDSDTRTRFGWLHENRVAEPTRDSSGDIPWSLAPLARRHSEVGHYRQALRGKDGLRDGLVHSKCRAQHAGTDVGDVSQFKKTLHGAVFSVGTVKNREDHVDAA